MKTAQGRLCVMKHRLEDTGFGDLRHSPSNWKAAAHVYWMKNSKAIQGGPRSRFKDLQIIARTRLLIIAAVIEGKKSTKHGS